MQLTLFGISHRSAPIDLRERVGFIPHEINAKLNDLQNTTHADACILLSTCNRMEILLLNGHQDAAINWLAKQRQICAKTLMDHGYILNNQQAIAHLIALCAGLQSAIVGEPQIFSQVKSALSTAQMMQTINPSLQFILEKCFYHAKIIRQHFQRSRSLGSSITHVISQQTKYQSNLRILLIGAGNMISQIIQDLQDVGMTNISIINRDMQRAQSLIDQHGQGEVFRLETLPDKLNNHDVVIAATHASEPLIQSNMLSDQGPRQLLIDLGLPRNIQANCRNHARVTLLDLDDLYRINTNDTNHTNDTVYNQHATIIDQACCAIWQDLMLRDNIASLTQVRQTVDQVKQSIINQSLLELKKGQDPEQIIIKNFNQFTNLLLHQPTVNIKSAIKKGNGDLVSLAMQLFSSTS